MNSVAGKRMNTRMEQVFTLVDIGCKAVTGRLYEITLSSNYPSSRDISPYKWKDSCPTHDYTLVPILITGVIGLDNKARRLSLKMNCRKRQMLDTLIP